MDQDTFNLISQRLDRLELTVDAVDEKCQQLHQKGQQRDLKVEIMTSAFNRLSLIVGSTAVVIVAAGAVAVLFGGH